MKFYTSIVIQFSLICYIICNHQIKGASADPKGKLHFSVSSLKNQTGHWETCFSVNKKSRKLPNSWKVDIHHNIEEQNGEISFHLSGVLTAPPPLPEDYELFHGIGYYKLHQTCKGFDDASSICSKEGGHLAIINSEAEAEVLKTIFARFPGLIPWAFIGIHDRQKEGEFITIFGEPLHKTGYAKWYSPNEPNGGIKENCVTMHRNGGLNDGECVSHLPFICEFDLSWKSM
ncbi:hypothetical protein J437_LFUL001546 [Ladona fulva]|uniref:C-type lectin domain-containing protein n=1 Tax=Ladona fulva TaxID=123851 RepID=A0A8K0JVU4_LADFU|nr:hypothetical protein J437_LFUL001546 [Ladona fulva]